MEGYIKTAIFGADNSFKFDIKSIGWMLRESGLNIQEFVQSLATNPYMSIPIVLYYGKKRAAEIGKDAFDAPFDEVYDWIEKEDDGMLSDSIQRVAKVFIDSAVASLPKSVQEKVKALEKEQGGKFPNGKKSTGKKI